MDNNFWNQLPDQKDQYEQGKIRIRRDEEAYLSDLRDQVAIAALQGMLSQGYYWGIERHSDNTPCLPVAALCGTSFELANAFIAEKKRRAESEKK